MAKAKARNSSNNKKKIFIPLWQKFFAGLLLVVVLGNAAGGYWAYKHWVVDAEEKQMTTLALQYAQEQANIVNEFMDEQTTRVRRIASREALVDALSEDNGAMVRRFEEEFLSSVTGAQLARIYTRGSAELDQDSAYPIRFAEVDMINRAERRQPVFPEASKIDDGWRITMVEPLPVATDGDTESAVIGTVFISLSANELLSRLGKSNTDAGGTQLFQQFDQGAAQPIVQLGERGVGSGEEVAIPNSYWRIRFIPSATLAQQAQVGSLSLFLALGVIFLLTIGVAYILAKLLANKFGDATAELAAQAIAAGERSENDFGDPMFHKKDILNVDVRDEDTGLLGLGEKSTDPLDIVDAAPAASRTASTSEIPGHIFRAYDIRGLAEHELSPKNVVAIGQAIGSQVLDAGESALFVARDGRSHSPDISEQLIEGIVSTGCNVVNLGMAPTPLMYFAIHENAASSSGVMVTASHNPAAFNGFKIVINNKTLLDDDIQALRARISQSNFRRGGGREDHLDISADYIDRIFSDVALAGDVNIVIDAGNGVAGKIAPRLFEELGCHVTPLFCDVDGEFPNHDPDPSVESNLQALIAKVQETGADLGIALDGDGDRIGLVTGSGKIVWPDKLLMLFAKDIVSRNPGSDVIFDVKCSRELNTVITTYGGRPIMWKSGHSPMKEKMRETKAVLGGEFSGHIFIAERWYGFDDGMYAAARLLEIMSLRDQGLDSVFSGLPELPSTPEIKIPIDDDKKFNFVRQLIEQSDFPTGRLTSLDGMRVDFENGWGLVRASNTSAALTLRFEAETDEALRDIQQQFKYQMLQVDNDLIIAF